MKNSWYKGSILVVLLITMITILFFFSPRANAAYLYEFQFGELTYNERTYEADGFSFTTPQLLFGMDFPDSPYISSLTFSTPLELNGFTFDSIMSGGASYVPVSVENLIGVSFSTDTDGSVDNGEIANFFVGFTFAPGTYGPGVYTNTDGFGRGIREFDEITYQYVGGSLTITEVAVPEPTTMLLVGFGLIGLVGLRRKV